MSASESVAHGRRTDDASAEAIRTEVLVVGSGAGGAVTAAALAAHGYEVAVLEEGPHVDTSQMSSNSIEAISRLYRNGGMTPILGNQTIAYVEGRCVGGSTEINSAFWHRLPPDAYDRWRAGALVVDLSAEIMDPYFAQIERELSVSFAKGGELPKSSVLFRQGAERLGWDYAEVPRCQRENAGGSPFAPGGKQSMQRTYLPRAIASGARLIPDCKAVAIRHQGGRARSVDAVVMREGRRTRIRVVADVVVVCCGAVQTPALLRRSGITRNVGNNLCIHPMIKAAALFDEEVEAHEAALPVYQLKEFWPTITIGGSVFTPGFLAMILAENWPMYQHAMPQWERMALYYAATRGMSRGTIRALPRLADGVVVRYRLSEADQQNLSTGLAHLGELLFAAGAKAVYPSVSGFPILRSPEQCRGLLKTPLPVSAMGLSTVHAFSSCPMGENPDLCATDSFGKVTGFRNLYVNDASLLPDSPGVNPQGTTMAVALRNVEHFVSGRRPGQGRGGNRAATASRPAVLVTGAPGWLGTRFAEVLLQGLPGRPDLVPPDPKQPIRCLVHPSADPSVLTALSDTLECATGDITDRDSLREFVRGAEGATLFHIAGLIHPARWTRDFSTVNVEGTRNLVEAATAAGVKRIVVVSSNSPIGCNPHPDHRFDEDSPYDPYMGYGRSKAAMESLVREAQASGKIETVLIRPPWFYGPHQPPRQTLFFTMIKEGRFPILGDGHQKRSMAYVDNICQGLLLAARTEQANGEIYWIADARPYSVNEIVDTVEDVLEREFGIACTKKRLRLPAVVGDFAMWCDRALQSLGLYQQKLHVLGEMTKTIACSIDKATRELGYRPSHSLREGMIASIDWCLANGLRF